MSPFLFGTNFFPSLVRNKTKAKHMLTNTLCAEMSSSKLTTDNKIERDSNIYKSSEYTTLVLKFLHTGELCSDLCLYLFETFL